MTDGQFIVIFALQLEVNKKFNFSLKQCAYFSQFLKTLDYDKREEFLHALL